MKCFYFAVLLFLSLSCVNNQSQVKNEDGNTTLLETNTKKTELEESFQETVGDSIRGDYDGDGKIEMALLKIVDRGIVDEKSWTLSVVFSNPRIKPIEFKCDKDYAILINEANLNSAGGDDITIYSPPNNGCTYSMTSYAYSNTDAEWTVVVPPFLIPTACDELSKEKLQQYVFKENVTIFYYETEPNTLELVKTPVM